MLCEKLKKILGYLNDSNMDILTRTLITEYSNRFEAARYADDCQGEVENIIKDFAEVQHKEPCVVKKGDHYGVYHELVDTMLVPAVYEELQAAHPDLIFDLDIPIYRYMKWEYLHKFYSRILVRPCLWQASTILGAYFGYLICRY